MSNVTSINKQARMMNKAKTFISRLIDAGYWGVIAVADGAPEGGIYHPSFSYTVGLHKKNLPELIIVGLNHLKAVQVLNHCAQISVDNGPIPNGKKLEELANMPTTILNVTESQKKLHAIQAYNYYKHWDFKLQQLVMPDKNCVFPWEPNFDTHMSLAQTFLGNYRDTFNL